MDTILTQADNGIGYITLNRPDKLNYLSDEMFIALKQTIESWDNRDDVQVIILRGNGKAFSSGFDVSSDPPTSVKEWLDQAILENQAPYSFWGSEKPIIAQVHGYCLGGANSLVLSCDMIIAAEDATFGEPEVRFGSISPFFMLPWMTHSKQAKELLLTGDRISAVEAKGLGLINKVVKREDLEKETVYLAEKIKKNDQITNGTIKYLTNQMYDIRGFKESMHTAEEKFAMLMDSDRPEANQFMKTITEKGFREAQRLRKLEITEGVEKSLLVQGRE
ncbi:enoyl-CoA hydratase/isomerase family protein [Radiobacillus sp. PE A8.2]|uniref:enoyl-CoA hydratase/isomerase family protein n=1 Tax=Radiobacillus sp. PE A8.2 TaxID=3380349 RepID=UPI00388D35C7